MCFSKGFQEKKESLKNNEYKIKFFKNTILPPFNTDPLQLQPISTLSGLPMSEKGPTISWEVYCIDI